MASLWYDVRFALRRIKARPGFSGVAIATIAVGVAIAAALFAVVDGVLLRPLPFGDPARLVAVWQTVPAWKGRPVLAAVWDRVPVSIPEYRALSADRTAFNGVAIWSEESLPLATGPGVDYVRVTRASWTMLSVLGVSPIRGRYFSPDEDRPNAQPVVLLSDETWHDRYGGAPDVVGRTIQLDRMPYVVIGILPPGLTLDRQQDARSESAGGAAFSEFWIPAGRDSAGFYDADQENYQLLARLRAGVPIAWAAQVADHLFHAASHAHETRGTRVESWQADQTRAARRPLLILWASACFLLLIACANVALLTLGESAGRQREIAIRVAVGAGRGQLVRQLSAESVVVCAAGAALALPLSVLSTKLLVAVAPLPLAAITAIHPDVRMLAFGLAATALSAFVAGAAPSVALLRVPPAAVINAGAQRTTGPRQPVQQFMIGVQAAVAIVLLIGAALLFRTSELIARVRPGFDPNNLLAAQLLLPTEIWSDTLRARVMYADLFTRLAGVPGVVAVSGTSEPPVVSGPSITSLTGKGEPRSTRHAVQYRAVVPGYFRTMGIPLRAGRDFTEDDRSGGEAVAIVSRTLAQRDLTGLSPVGQQVQLLGTWRTLIGVVDDVHFARLSDTMEPTIYVPFVQLPGSQLDVVIRAQNDPVLMERTVRSIIRERAPTVGVRRIDVMTSAIRRTFAEERYRAALMAMFSIIATFLTAISTYGVTVRNLRHRSREAAIRFSLGASNASVMTLMMGTTASGLAGGAAAGVLVAVVAERWLRPYLFHVSATDPGLYGGVLLGLSLLVLGTNWLAVRRLSGLDLATVLNSESI